MADLFQPPATPEPMHGVHHGTNDSDTNTTTTTTTNTTVGTVVARIEGILESVLRNLSEKRELSVDFVSRQGTRHNSSENRIEQIRFPGRTLQEAKRFARVLLILQLAHDALVSGTVLTKRHIYYQHQDLFEKQSQVDTLVDDIASFLGLNRADLNIVAASKASLAGHLAIHLRDGTSLDPTAGEAGMPIPARASISSLDLTNVKWILVIEKDAIYRSLCSTRFWSRATCGPGVLVTAKGYPDLISRQFLHYVNTINPNLLILGLMDLDPDGVNILRCYRHGSKRLSHELDACTPSMQWLGIRTHHILDFTSAAFEEQGNYELDERARATATSTSCEEPISYLTERDRTAAIRTLCKIASHGSQDYDGHEVRREMQVMLMLGCKAEIEWLDDSGNLNEWLDGQISAALSTSH